MNEQEKEDWEVEELLKGVSVAGPSPYLDRRVAALFRPSWRMWIGPVAGFAAGVAATVAVVLMIPRESSNRTVQIGQIGNTGTVRPATVTEKPRPALLIEDPHVRTLGDMNVDGHPVRIEYRQPHLIMLEKGDNGSLVRTDMVLPGQTVMRAVQSN